jgi:hypothetical protein
MRRAVWWSLLVAPPAGVTYGAHGIWSWETTAREPLNHRGTGVARPWREALALPGSGQMEHVKKLFTRFEWWRLRPSPSLLVEQPGDRDATAFVPIATALDETFTIAYLPKGGSVRLRLTRPGIAQWFDPRTGNYRPRTRFSAEAEFRAPDTRDWVLVLTSPLPDSR